jgi:hypothetical protein
MKKLDIRKITFLIAVSCATVLGLIFQTVIGVILFVAAVVLHLLLNALGLNVNFFVVAISLFLLFSIFFSIFIVVRGKN